MDFPHVCRGLINQCVCVCVCVCVLYFYYFATVNAGVFRQISGVSAPNEHLSCSRRICALPAWTAAGFRVEDRVERNMQLKYSNQHGKIGTPAASAAVAGFGWF